MRFLCLPGAYGSAKNFGVQLGPFAKHMEDRGLATFAFTQGSYEVEPPVGWENYFGARPLYRFIEAAQGDAFEIVRRVRHIPRGLSPEATLRLFSDGGRSDKDKKPTREDWQPFGDALDRLMKIVDDDPDIDGLIGYSEGAMMAACICAEENRRWEEKGVPRRIKFAIFFAGSPPLVRENDESGLFAAKLADEHGTIIKIPTFHVFGSNDPLVYSSVALYNSCDQDAAQLYDHGLGHLVPRDADNVEQLGDTLSDVITRINNERENSDDVGGKGKDVVDVTTSVVVTLETTTITKFVEEEEEDTKSTSAGSSAAESSSVTTASASGPSSAASSAGSATTAESDLEASIAKIHLK